MAKAADPIASELYTEVVAFSLSIKLLSLKLAFFGNNYIFKIVIEKITSIFSCNSSFSKSHDIFSAAD